MASLVSSSTSQAVVQLTAPAARRGRFIGAYSMASAGSRVGSGVIVGALGAWLGVTWALAVDAAILLVAVLALLALVTVAKRRMRAAASDLSPSERDAISEA